MGRVVWIHILDVLDVPPLGQQQPDFAPEIVMSFVAVPPEYGATINVVLPAKLASAVSVPPPPLALHPPPLVVRTIQI